MQLSMDGPYVNWDVLEKLMKIRDEMEFSGMINIGSCGLHVLHGAFQHGIKSQWNLKQIFTAMFFLFNDSPARREVYTQLRDSEKFAYR